MAKLERGILAKAQIDESVAEMIELSANEPDIGVAGVLPDFHTLLKRLQRATAFIAKEIERRVSHSLENGSDRI